MKRVIDISLATLALVALSPLLLPVMLALRLTGEGEIFYRQKRLTRGQRPFNILKFATMLKDSPNLPGGEISSRGDPRVLPLGHFLRASKINELPQLLNIITGDMSIIGPRPLTPSIAAMFSSDYWQKMREIRPGLSGVGSIVFRDEENLLAGLSDRRAVYLSTIVPHKAALELWYASHQSLIVDLKLILLTIMVVVRPQTQLTQYFDNLPPPPADLVALRKRQALAGNER